MEAAEAWGVPPWEITDQGSKYLWYARWSSYTTTVNKAMREKRNEAKGNRNR